jgi:hypothetical protein
LPTLEHSILTVIFQRKVASVPLIILNCRLEPSLSIKYWASSFGFNKKIKIIKLNKIKKKELYHLTLESFV